MFARTLSLVARWQPLVGTLLLLALAGGCGGRSDILPEVKARGDREKAFASIKYDMTVDEVRAALGPPASTLNYKEPGQGDVIVDKWTQDGREIQIRYVLGKVADIFKK